MAGINAVRLRWGESIESIKERNVWATAHSVRILNLIRDLNRQTKGLIYFGFWNTNTNLKDVGWTGGSYPTVQSC